MADFGGDPEAFRAEARTWLEANFPKSLKGKGVNYIEDVKAFKAGLALSDPPKPLVPWDELLTSKY